MPFNANVKTLEELGELSTIIAKKMMYPDTDDHPDGAGSMKRRIEDEVADVRATTEMLIRHHALDRSYIEERRRKKIAKFVKWAKTEMPLREYSMEQYGNEGMQRYFVRPFFRPVLHQHIDGTSEILEKRMRESIAKHIENTQTQVQFETVDMSKRWKKFDGGTFFLIVVLVVVCIFSSMT